MAGGHTGSHLVWFTSNTEHMLPGRHTQASPNWGKDPAKYVKTPRKKPCVGVEWGLGGPPGGLWAVLR